MFLIEFNNTAYDEDIDIMFCNCLPSLRMFPCSIKFFPHVWTFKTLRMFISMSLALIQHVFLKFIKCDQEQKMSVIFYFNILLISIHVVFVNLIFVS